MDKVKHSSVDENSKKQTEQVGIKPIVNERERENLWSKE